MNPVFLTVRPQRELENHDQVRALWNDDAEFRVYRYAVIVRRTQDSNRLLAAGFTHARVVWQDREFRVHSTDIEIKAVPTH